MNFKGATCCYLVRLGGLDWWIFGFLDWWGQNVLLHFVGIEHSEYGAERSD
jgi:hypothetical protein